MNRIFNEIANRYNVNPEEVEKDITQALSIARRSTSPHARAFWGKVDEKAGVEEVLCHIAERVRSVV